jgi:uncharacterized protein YndB with AHSA1/START domain
MPSVTRKRIIRATPPEVWNLVADPYHLARWWPRTMRVENVQKVGSGKRSHWTKVLAAREGRSVRADFRCIAATEPSRYVWEQELEDTPFARYLRSNVVELGLTPVGDGTELAVTCRQRLRGLSRLGSPMMRSGTGRTLDEALDAVELAVGGGQGEE